MTRWHAAMLRAGVPPGSADGYRSRARALARAAGTAASASPVASRARLGPHEAPSSTCWRTPPVEGTSAPWISACSPRSCTWGLGWARSGRRHRPSSPPTGWTPLPAPRCASAGVTDALSRPLPTCRGSAGVARRRGVRPPHRAGLGPDRPAAAPDQRGAWREPRRDRLRETWLARHLARGVPLDVLAAAAGTRLAQLNALIEGQAPRSPAEVLAWTAQRERVSPAV